MSQSYYNEGGYQGNSNYQGGNPGAYQGNYPQGGYGQEGYYQDNVPQPSANPPQQGYGYQDNYYHQNQQPYGGGNYQAEPNYQQGNYQGVNYQQPNRDEEIYYPAHEEIHVDHGYRAGTPVRLSKQLKWLLIIAAVLLFGVAIYLIVNM